MKVKISQSLIKDLDKYFDGDKCGHLIYHKYANGVFEYPSEPMEEGIYFEYVATGALPKSGEEPEPKLTQKGELTAPYKRAKEQAQLFKSLCDKMGIKVLSTQETRDKNGLIGTMDIEADWNGKLVTIDLKYSGLINDKWNEMGWSDLYGDNDRGKQYRHHSTQSLQYTYIFERPFFFWVFSSVNVGENIMIEMRHESEQLEGHVLRAKESAKRWNILAGHEKAGLSAIPDYLECQKCPIFEKCNHKTVIPIPKTVEYE